MFSGVARAPEWVQERALLDAGPPHALLDASLVRGTPQRLPHVAQDVIPRSGEKPDGLSPYAVRLQ
jgi:hypothetical protein